MLVKSVKVCVGTVRPPGTLISGRVSRSMETCLGHGTRMSSFPIAMQALKQLPDPFQVPEEQSDQGSACSAAWQRRVESCLCHSRDFFSSRHAYWEHICKMHHLIVKTLYICCLQGL